MATAMMLTVTSTSPFRCPDVPPEPRPVSWRGRVLAAIPTQCVPGTIPHHRGIPSATVTDLTLLSCASRCRRGHHLLQCARELTRGGGRTGPPLFVSADDTHERGVRARGAPAARRRRCRAHPYAGARPLWRVQGLKGGARAYFVWRFLTQYPQPALLVLPSAKDAEASSRTCASSPARTRTRRRLPAASITSRRGTSCPSKTCRRRPRPSRHASRGCTICSRPRTRSS